MLSCCFDYECSTMDMSSGYVETPMPHCKCLFVVAANVDTMLRLWLLWTGRSQPPHVNHITEMQSVATQRIGSLPLLKAVWAPTE